MNSQLHHPMVATSLLLTAPYALPPASPSPSSSYPSSPATTTSFTPSLSPEDLTLSTTVASVPPSGKPYTCLFPSCNKSFARKSDLKRHKRIHSNDRPYVCDQCNKGFIQRSALIVHQRTHTGERPHRCSFEGCDKAFADSSSLARHRRAHDNQRPHTCPVGGCSKTFSRRNTLQKHMAVHHPLHESLPDEDDDYTTPPSTIRADSERTISMSPTTFANLTTTPSDRTISLSPSSFNLSRHATPEPVSMTSTPASSWSASSFMMEPVMYDYSSIASGGWMMVVPQQPVQPIDMSKIVIPQFGYGCACGAPGCTPQQPQLSYMSYFPERF